MPEISSGNVSSEKSYLEYYFLKNYHLSDVNADMILLHNSWTPPEFKQVPPDKFFYYDCTMVNVLAEALGIKLPSKNRLRIRTGVHKD